MERLAQYSLSRMRTIAARHELDYESSTGRLVLLRSVPKSELVRALSWLTIPALMGPMLGPVLGGFITTYSNWRFIFLINIPMGLLGIWLAGRHIPLLRRAV